LKAILNIFSDRTREKNWLLLHDGHVLLEALWVQILEILVSILNLSSIWVVEPLNELDDG
jgi:hypothetical protein